MSWISDAMKVDTMQVSAKLRRATNGYTHWCPACDEMHILPDSWGFDGNLEVPTFTPSFRHTFHGDRQCHYTLTAGVLTFHNDCTHAMVNQVVALPDLPPEMCDPSTKEERMEPTKGRMVYFVRSGVEHAAVVTHVHNATLINCVVFDCMGQAATLQTSVGFDGNESPRDGSWHWPNTRTY